MTPTFMPVATVRPPLLFHSPLRNSSLNFPLLSSPFALLASNDERRDTLSTRVNPTSNNLDPQ